MIQRRGLGDGSSINSTTIWTPQTGFLTGGGAAPAVYQAPSAVAVPACSQDTRPGGAAFSDACIAQVLAAQQTRFQLANNANYSVDLTNCLNTFPQPPDCYSRTFGLTPAGGFTSDASATGPQLILDAGGNVVDTPPPVSTLPVTPRTPAISTVSAPGTSVGSGSSAAAATGLVLSSAGIQNALSATADVGGYSIPWWEIAAAAAAALFIFGGSKH